jgi:FHA domain
MMAVCPKGHDSSTADYCDVCGTPIAGDQAPDQAPAPAAAECPLCGSPQSGRFCERDGYDFLAAALSPGTPPEQPPPQPTPVEYVAVVGADQAYFEKVKAAGGPDAGLLEFPRFLPERRFPLRGGQVLIGRRSRSRGVYPDIDLVGPPEDPGVSHSHALLVSQPGNGWAVVDVGSSNGTYVNDTANAIDVNVPVPVRDGDRVYLGAWTVITLRAA